MAKYNREQIILKGIELLQQEGFVGFGILKLLKVCNMPKGSFYNFFESKEAFVKEAIEYYNSAILQKIDEIDKAPLNEYQKIETFFISANKFFADGEYKKSCPMINITTDSIMEGNLFSDLITQNFNSHKAYLQKWISIAQETGLIKNLSPAAELTHIIYDNYHGAVIRMKYEKSDTPLENYIKNFLPMVLQKSDN